MISSTVEDLDKNFAEEILTEKVSRFEFFTRTYVKECIQLGQKFDKESH